MSDDEINEFSLAASMTTLIEMIQPIREAVLGYKAQLSGDGWSDSAAEKMAVELHNALIRKAFSA